MTAGPTPPGGGNTPVPPGPPRPANDDAFGLLALEEGQPTEILALLNQLIAAGPPRADLWTMRFEIQKTLGLKQEFSDTLVEAWHHATLSRQLDWDALRLMWDDVAPDEAPPVRLPEPKVGRGPGATVTPPGVAHNRRFADIAQQIAGRELAVLAKAYAALQARPHFFEDFARNIGKLLHRPTPLQFSEGLTRLAGGEARIFLKREDQRQVTSEKENATAHAYVAAMMGRPMVITGNDVDAHSLALAEVAPSFKLRCVVVVRPADVQQKPGLIAQLRACGAEIQVMPASGMIGNDPREAALGLWLRAMGHAHLALSLGTGPNPYPAMVNNFQSLLGRETELQMRAIGDGRPRTLVAAVESEADSIGFVLPQLGNPQVELLYAEPEPGGVASWRPSARLRAYNGAVREHVWLRNLGRIEHVTIPDSQARASQQQLASLESIRASLEDARATALTLLMTQRGHTGRDYVVLVA